MPVKIGDTLAQLMKEPAQQAWGFAMAQLPDDNLNSPAWMAGALASQVMLPNVISYRISRTQDMASDTLELTFADDDANMMSTNANSTLGLVFKPGPVDKKIIFYMGLRGQIFPGRPYWSYDVSDAILQFTGFVQTDSSAQTWNQIDKTVTIPDLSAQFRMQVYDTFPHPLFGNQILPYFDSSYNLTPIDAPMYNDGSGNLFSKSWQCDGRMFTTNAEIPVYGASHIDPRVYINATPHYDSFGNYTNPVSTPVDNNTFSPPIPPSFIITLPEYTFDYANGIVTFADSYLSTIGFPNGLPAGTTANGSLPGDPKVSVVSVSGNPTYMAPEIIVRKLLVEKAQWSPDFINAQPTNTLIPMFDGQDRSVWDCLKSVAAITCPRFVPWNIWVDENGVVCFYEQNLDQPAVKHYIDGANIFNVTHEYTSRDLRTVVRGDASVAVPDLVSSTPGASSDQAITSIAYDIRAINEYGQTEPLLLTQDVTDAVRHLTPTQALSHLNMVAQSVLYSSSRPTLTLTGSVVPDYSLQIGDKVGYYDDNTGQDREFTVQTIEKSGDGTSHEMQITLEEYYETVNLNLGTPAAVTATFFAATISNSNGNTVTGTALAIPTGTEQAPPTGQLINSVRLGDNGGLLVYQAGDYARDSNGDPIVAGWVGDKKTPMVFDIFLSPAYKAMGEIPPNKQPFNYHRLPPAGPTSGSTILAQPWEQETDPHGRKVWYVPHNTGTVSGGGTADGYTYYVGPDSVFYRYKNGTDPTNGGNSDYHAGPPDVPPQTYNYIWTPPGNSPIMSVGGTITGGIPYNVYVWQWWYLCLDSNLTDPVTGNKYYDLPQRSKLGRLLMRVNPSQDGQKISVASNAGYHITNYWTSDRTASGTILPPGPDFNTAHCTKIYGSLNVGLSDYTATPAGFVGANVMQDGVNIGVAYGNDAPSTALYVNYTKRVKGHYCIFAAADTGQTQFLRFPFWMSL